MKKILIAFLFFNLLNATDDLSSLLNRYEKESDLSKQTKVESLGHVVVFTRRDLDRMQFERLDDVLKYVKLSTSSKSRFGRNGLSDLGKSSVFPSSVRLYLNDMDLSYAHTDSPFFTYSNLSLAHIDHIEIYLGAAALKLGNYPSSIVIKLYTKKPDREDSVIFKTRYYSNDSSIVDAFVAKKIDTDSDYLILLDNSIAKDKDITIHNQNVKNSYKQQNLYVNYRYKKSNFELSYIGIKSKPFMGLSKDDAPDYIDMYGAEYYLMYTYNDKDNYKLNVSYTANNRNYKEKNKESDGGLLLPMLDGTPTYLHEKRDTNKFNLSLSKKFITANNSLFTSVSVQDRINDVKKFDYTNGSGSHDGRDKLNIKSVKNYSIALEDNYNITERNLFFSSFKYDSYDGDGDYKDANNYIARVGFITIPNEKLKMKGFLTKSYLPVTILQQEFAKDRLKQANGKMATFETIYNQNNNEYSFLIGWMDAKNAIIFDKNAVAKNSDKKMIAKYFSLSYKNEFTKDSKIDLSYSRIFFNKNISSKESIIGKIVSTIDKFDIFTGIVYNSKYHTSNVDVSSAFDMDIGINYHLNRHISVKLKGNNIFNDSTKSVYKTDYSSGTYDNDTRDYSISLEVGF
jgi:vitamin B12 transporter